MAYNFKSSEKQWQDFWDREKVFKTDNFQERDPFYILTMFPYPSGDKLHMGHWFQYGIMDSWARYKKLQGEKIFHPMGFDAFGLPAENYAIKKGVHPARSTEQNVNYMIKQFKRMGVSYDWDYSLNTSDPEYYRWTQWLFLQLYNRGLAYMKKAPVNWCPSCHTVLANEQVQNGRCERCDSETGKKELNQWFFKITDYAGDLLDGLDSLDWSEKTKAMQKNWIGRSKGTEIRFPLSDSLQEIPVFTTRADTIYGVTYLVLAPEHPMVSEITKPAHSIEIKKYQEKTNRLSEIERLSAHKEKRGVFTGSYAINPINKEKIPVWIADYVLSSYGTGAVMAVPAHDQRDFLFARNYGLPLRQVVQMANGESVSEEAFTETGILIDSGPYTGQMSHEAISHLNADLKAQNRGNEKIVYRLRDWLISRQRYWGCPIPIIHCPECGMVPVPQDQLPVLLPENIEFTPHGDSPLKNHKEFNHISCPACGKPARREADTLDTFVCSSWYYLRFPSVNRKDVPFDRKITGKFLPVDRYCGGPEHTCMHLLYARFVSHVLHDMGYLDFKEPFPHLTHQGLVLGKDGNKMSKSKGNSVSPDPYVEKYGSDVLRLYLLFGFNFTEGGSWNDGGFKAITHFIDKIHRVFGNGQKIILPSKGQSIIKPETIQERELLYLVHSTIKKVTKDMERFMFNTSVARLMEMATGLNQYLSQVSRPHQNREMLASLCKDFIILLAPYAPHLSEELWQHHKTASHEKSVFLASWPVYSEEYLKRDEISLAVMINGKLRAQIKIVSESTEEQIIKVALKQPNILRHMAGKTLINHIYIPGKLVNFMIN